MVEQLVAFFLSFFANPSTWGIGLALIFGAIWLVGYWPPLFKKHWLWAVLATSAILSLVAVTLVQIPLQALTGRALGFFWSQDVLMRWIMLAAIPQILYSGLVQEGSKLVPVVVYWWRKDRSIDPKMGLVVGAVAGVGFGVFEAQWAHNTIFASGWNWGMVQSSGVIALAGFWERFFVVAFHTASCALAGWGLAKGWGWQFYLLASFTHAFINYSAVLLQSGVVNVVQLEIFAAVVAVLVTGVVLWLRWRKPAIVAEVEAESEVIASQMSDIESV